MHTGALGRFEGFLAALFNTSLSFTIVGPEYLSMGVRVYGYTSFKPWDALSFFSAYTMPLLSLVLFSFWIVVKRKKLLKPQEVDLVWERPIIDAYEDASTTPAIGFWAEMAHLWTFEGSEEVFQLSNDENKRDHYLINADELD